MRDYEELVERLRICPDYNEGCKNCPHEHDLGCRTTMMAEAADVIEELMTHEALYQQLNEKGQAVARKLIDAYPRWISVEERLPETADEPVFTWTSDGDLDVLCRLDFEPFGVTHWMPLPEPPKEEK